MLHRTSRDKLVWRLQGRCIGYTGLVVINYSLESIEKIHMLHMTSRDKLVWCLQRKFIVYTELVDINYSDVYRKDS